jgi:hypothetical protein
LAADDILLDDILAGIDAAVVVEDYRDAQRGPSILLLQQDATGRPVHVVWGLSATEAPLAVLVTAYRPDHSKVVSGFHEAEQAMTRQTLELVREGKYAAEVAIELIEEEGGWSPYLSIEDARKLEAVRSALRKGDIAAAAKYGRVFELTPVSA